MMLYRSIPVGSLGFIRLSGQQVDKMAKAVISLSRRNCRRISGAMRIGAMGPNVAPPHQLPNSHRTGYAHKRSDNIESKLFY
jgi:hypothetical protein